jgi:flagellin
VDGGIKIGSNLASLRAQRTLSQTSNALGRIYERLSSGQRINRASDDSAGLAIADDLRADARLYNTSARNINDGISVVNIVSGALDAQKGILTRLSELAEQASNGVYSEKQRSAMNDEYQSLVEEFGRIAQTTKFNGVPLLMGGRNGNSSELTIQAGITGDANSQLTMKLADTGPFSGIAGAFGDYDLDGVLTSFDYDIWSNFVSAGLGAAAFGKMR